MPTSPLSRLLPRFVERLQSSLSPHAAEVLAAWPEVIIPSWAKATRVHRFYRKALHIKVLHSSLYTILRQYHTSRLLLALQHRCPSAGLERLIFHFG